MKIPIDTFNLKHDKNIVEYLTSVEDLNAFISDENEEEVYKKLKEIKDKIDFQEIFKNFQKYNILFLKVILTIYSEDDREITEDFMECAFNVLAALKNINLINRYMAKWKIKENLNKNNIEKFLTVIELIGYSNLPDNLEFLLPERNPTRIIIKYLDKYKNVVDLYCVFNNAFVKSLFLLGFVDKKAQKDILIKTFKSITIPRSVKREIILNKEFMIEYGHLSVVNEFIMEEV